MKVLIAYGTTEGQTRKIVDAAAAQVIALGHDAEVFDTSLLLDGLHPETFDKIIVAGYHMEIGYFGPHSGLKDGNVTRKDAIRREGAAVGQDTKTC